MDYVKRADIAEHRLPGRVVQNAVGHSSAVASERMTVSFCRYSAESGPMAPHNHAEESVVVLDCRVPMCSMAPARIVWSTQWSCRRGTCSTFRRWNGTCSAIGRGAT